MKRHAIVAGEPDHTGLGWLSRGLQRLFSRPAGVNLTLGGERVGQHVDREAEVEPPRGLRRLPRGRRGAEAGR